MASTIDRARMSRGISALAMAAALAVMRRHAVSGKAARIGLVTHRPSPPVILRTVVGTHRILDLLSGEQLPRIC